MQIDLYETHTNSVCDDSFSIPYIPTVAKPFIDPERHLIGIFYDFPANQSFGNYRSNTFISLFVLPVVLVANEDSVADTNAFHFTCARNVCCVHNICDRDTKYISDSLQKHFVSATNVSLFARPRKHHEHRL